MHLDISSISTDEVGMENLKIVFNEKIKYFGGFNQNEVKPTGESPLLKLGIENVPPIITSNHLLNGCIVLNMQ